MNAVSGDYCTLFAADNDITTAQLYAWNTVLGANGENCGTLLQVGVDYCVGIASLTMTATSLPPTTTVTATSSLPYPTQSGIVSNCNKFQVAVAGDYCSIFAEDNSITTTQLYTWNPVLGLNGENCGTLLQANVDYCVGVVIPTQSGIAANCDKIVVAQSGDYCYIFAQDNGMLPFDFPACFANIHRHHDCAVIYLVRFLLHIVDFYVDLLISFL